MKKGLLISFEGIDGSGKSTQAALLNEYLLSLGKISSIYREPGGTSIGEKIRSILLDKNNSLMTPYSELFLYLAARAQLSREIISPAIDSGEIIILDRFIDSTIAYQGYARGLDVYELSRLNLLATDGLFPDITFLIDCNSSSAFLRLSNGHDRLESEGIFFLEKVRKGFLSIRENEPDRVFIFDGSKSITILHQEIISLLKKKFSF